MKYFIALAAFAITTHAFAGNFSASAIPSGIDIVQAGTAGFLVTGNFGNPAGCTVNNAIFVKATHPQYAKLYATALAAFMGGKSVFAYARVCEPVLWYSVASVTYNIVTDDDSFSIRN